MESSGVLAIARPKQKDKQPDARRWEIFSNADPLPVCFKRHGMLQKSHEPLRPGVDMWNLNPSLQHTGGSGRNEPPVMGGGVSRDSGLFPGGLHPTLRGCWRTVWKYGPLD